MKEKKRKTSWLDHRRTHRIYHTLDRGYILVHNEFQKIQCPHCSASFFGRSTHIDCGLNPLKLRPFFEHHQNYSKTLKSLKELLVRYTGEGKIPVTEELIETLCCLMEGEKMIGHEINPELLDQLRWLRDGRSDKSLK